MREPGLDERPLLRVADVDVERRAELRGSRLRVLFLRDQAAHAHHVGKRPVGDALAVGQAAPAVPVDRLGDAVEVLVELPRQPGLANASDSGDGDEVRLSLLGAGVDEILDLAKLAVASYARRLQPLR